jgi:hypothetical protein
MVIKIGTKNNSHCSFFVLVVVIRRIQYFLEIKISLLCMKKIFYILVVSVEAFRYVLR